jgi:trans-aconitate 2-methyltransferase
MERRKWKGDEIVLDAGCGSGRPAKILAAKVPKGRVYAVDRDPNMVQQAQAGLRDCGNVQVVQSDIATVRLPEKVDVVFSNAVLHWVPDHGKVFANFVGLLKEGGELLAQCGGEGNLKGALAVFGRVASGEPFSRHFTGWKEPWHFAPPQSTEKLLRGAGFKDARAALAAEPVSFASREEFSAYIRTVVIRPHLAQLPVGLQGRFLEACLDECETRPQKWLLDYVRLNISAKK